MITSRMLFVTVFIAVISVESCDEEYIGQIPNTSHLLTETSSQEHLALDEDLYDMLETKSPTKNLDYYILPSSFDYKNIPQDPKNKLTSFKVLLGKKLFCEPALAINPKKEEGKSTYSCATCHVPSACFTAGVPQGIGEGGEGFGKAGEKRRINNNYLEDEIDVQAIRTSTIINIAYNKTTLWNGQFGSVAINQGTEKQWREGTPIANNHLGFEGIETQAIAGMDVHRLDIDESFIFTNYYKAWFDSAFPDVPEKERYTKRTAGLALAAFERTVFANQAPFQKWLRGETNAMTVQQKQGATLFFGKAKCNTCHDGAALNAETFHALGMDDFQIHEVLINNQEDFEKLKLGRGGFTKKEEDLYRFKTPQLYSLKQMGFYGHGSSFRTIRQVIEYKNAAIPQNSNVPSDKLDENFSPLGLTPLEITQLTDFIENALEDSNMDRYTPKDIASGLCFPNNDPKSQTDMNCK